MSDALVVALKAAGVPSSAGRLVYLDAPVNEFGHLRHAIAADAPRVLRCLLAERLEVLRREGVEWVDIQDPESLDLLAPEVPT